MEFVMEWRGLVHRVLSDWNTEVIYTRREHLDQMCISCYLGWMVDITGLVYDKGLSLQVPTLV